MKITTKPLRFRPGPWTYEPDSFHWEYRETHCYARRSRMGNWCGYVAVPKGSPLERASSEEWDMAVDNFAVHGGVTWHGKESREDILEEFGPLVGRTTWLVVGFDCAHFADLVPAISGFAVNDAPERSRLFGLTAAIRGLGGTYRDLGFVIHETQALADQILAWPDMVL